MSYISSRCEKKGTCGLSPLERAGGIQGIGGMTKPIRERVVHDNIDGAGVSQTESDILWRYRSFGHMSITLPTKSVTQSTGNKKLASAQPTSPASYPPPLLLARTRRRQSSPSSTYSGRSTCVDGCPYSRRTSNESP